MNSVIRGKLLESQTLQQQAANNTKEQFANSPDIQHGIKDILLNHARLWEALRERSVSE